MSTRPLSLLLPLGLLACPAGPDGKLGTDGVSGTDGAAGTDGSAGTDGAAGTDGTDDLALASGTLAPGEFLSLTHELGAGAYAEAQFTWEGVVYDARDYATLRPGHVGTGSWLRGSGADGYTGRLGAARLASGDVVVAQGTFTGDWDDEFFSVDILGWDGSPVAHADTLPEEWSDADGYGDRYDPQVVALADGGFVVLFEVDASSESVGWYEAIEVHRYDDAGLLLGTELLGDSDVEYSSAHAVPTAAGGFAAALYGWDDDADDDVLDVVTWAPGAGASSFRVADVDDSDVRIAELPDGRFGILAERWLSEDEPDGIEYLVVQTDGTIDAATRLQNSYMQEDSDVVVGHDGTVLVTAESGGPDLPFYAVFDLDGAVILPATGMSGWENDQIHAGAFADGDFLVIVWEDDSNAPMTWVMDAQGAILRPMVVGDITVVPDDTRGAFIPGPGNTLGFVAASYESELPAHLATYTKGLLELRIESDTEVRLYNETPDTLDVTIAAHGTP
jgi:hypothetical protein